MRTEIHLFTTDLELVWLERLRSVPLYKVTVSDRFKTEGQPLLYAKLSRNRTADPLSISAEQAPSITMGMVETVPLGKIREYILFVHWIWGIITSDVFPSLVDLQ